MKQSLKPAVVCNLAFLVFALLSPSAQGNSDSVSPFSQISYRTGERLTYNVSFSNFISAAHVELEVGGRGVFFGREGIQLRAHVETKGVVHAALFAINNDYLTYVDPVTGLPFHSQQVVRDGTRTSDTARAFNNPVIAEANPSKQRAGEFPGTYDFLSAIYRLRALPLAEGATYYLTVKGETEEYQTEVKVTGRQTVQTNVGSFNTLVSQIRVMNNAWANSYRLRIFFSDDSRHVPVLITARIATGELSAELAGLEFVKPEVSPTTTGTPPIPGPTPAVSPQPTSENGTLDNLPFKVGEQLNYQVFVGGITSPAGNATFQVRARARHFDRDALLFTLQAQTTNAAQRLFFANDQISSYVDPKTLLPFRSESKLIEGSRRLNQTLTINQEYGTATTDKGERIEIPIGTHEYLSFFYLARTFTLTPPRRNAVSILVNNKPKTLFITSLQRETVQIGSQTIPAIQLSLTTDDPQPDKYLFRVWISDDKRRLPLRLTATTQLGQIRADLAIIPLTAQ